MAKSAGRAGMLLLGIYLILVGVQSVFGFGFPSSGIILGVLALLAGILLLLGR